MKTRIAFLIFAVTTFARAENKKAIELISQNKYTEAIVELSTSLKTNNKDAVDWFNLGVASYKNKNYPASVRALQKVVELKSDLKDAALYYKALGEFNQLQNETALRSIGAISDTSRFYKTGNELKAAIENQSDDIFLEAKAAFEEEDYEGCVESIKDSLLSDHPTGIQLLEKCKNKITEASSPAPVIAQKESSKIYISARLNGSSSNNAYLTNSATTRRFSLEAAFAAEYLYSAESSDFGAGITYESSASGSGSTSSSRTIDGRESQTMLYAPYTKYFSNQEISAEPYYSATTVDSISAYYQQGLSLNYIYNWSDYNFSFSPELSRKIARNTTYAYMEGTYSSMKAALSYEKESTKASLYINPSLSATADESVTGGTIPYANRAIDVGATMAQWLGQSYKISAVFSSSKKNYTNKYSSIYREDQTRYFKIQGLYKSTANTKVYIESANTTNVSNYDNTQLVNKNYTENVISLGVVFSN